MSGRDWIEWRWRPGLRPSENRLGIYAIVGEQPSDDDVLIGTMNSFELALNAASDHNTVMGQAAQAARLAYGGS